MKRVPFAHIIVTPANGQPVVITARPSSAPKTMTVLNTVSHFLTPPIRTGPGAPYTPPSATHHGLATR